MSETADDGSVTSARPERIVLTDQQKDRVRDHLAKRRKACGSCRGTEFVLGTAVYLGFLWRSEDTDAYMIALTCTNPQCAAPKTGLRLTEREFGISTSAS